MGLYKHLFKRIFILISLSNFSIGFSTNFEQYAELNDTTLKEFFDPYRKDDEVYDYPNTIDVSFKNSVHTIGILSDGRSHKLHILKPRKKSPEKIKNQQVMVRVDLREFGINPRENLLLKAAAAGNNAMMVALFDDAHNKNYLFKISDQYQVELLALPSDVLTITEINNADDLWILNSGALISSNNGRTWEDFEVNGNISGPPINIKKINGTYFGLSRRLINPVAPLELYRSQDLIDWELVQVPTDSEQSGSVAYNITKIYAIHETLVVQLWKLHLAKNVYSYLYSTDNGISWQKVERELTESAITDIFAKNGKLNLIRKPKIDEKLRYCVIADENYLFNPTIEKETEIEIDDFATVFNSGNYIDLVINNYTDNNSHKKYYTMGHSIT